jgi:hypothetical protein
MVGDACREFTKKLIGRRIYVHEFTDGMHGIGNSMWILEESMLDRTDSNGEPLIKPFTVDMGDS